MSGSPDSAAAPSLPGERRLAMVVATQTYVDPALRQLRAPSRDVEDLRQVLADKEMGAFEVTAVIDRPAHEIRLAIEDFLVDRRTNDLLLIYLTCHGLVDVRRRLFFAAADTRKDRLAATGVEAQWLLQQLDDCRARRQVVILDCCFSGAFANTAKGDSDLGLGERLHGDGRGRVVLTASRGSEYSFEGEPVAGSEMPGSVFTSALVNGIRSGAADVDRDGFISVDDAYEYAFDQLRAAAAHQTPQRWLYGAEGDIFLARSPAGVPAAPLPDELRDALDSRHVHIRLGAVAALGELLTDPVRALPAQRSLQQVADTDVPRVASAARALVDGRPDTYPPGQTMAPPIPASVPRSTGTARPEPVAPVASRSSARRRWLVIGAAALAGLIVAALAILINREAGEPLAENEFQATAPWRLIIRNNNYCTVTVRSRESDDVWTNRYTTGKDMSFQMHQSGTFRWESTTSECLVVHQPGAGELGLPAVVAGGKGDTNAFPAAGSVKVEAKDFHDTPSCDFDLIDSESGDTVDTGRLSSTRPNVVLQTEGRSKVYLANGYCTVRISYS
ncbi:MAG TPA: hypothetical protein VIT42_04435 [Microlunatus sp.]